MPCGTCCSDKNPPRCPLAVEGRVGIAWVGKALVQCKSNRLQGGKFGRLQQLAHAIHAPDLLIGHKGEVHSPGGHNSLHFHPLDGKQVLHAHALHILCAAPIQATILYGGGPWVNSPVFRQRGHHVVVGVQQQARKGGVRAQPRGNEYRLASNRLHLGGLEADTLTEARKPCHRFAIRACRAVAAHRTNAKELPKQLNLALQLGHCVLFCG
mmetsp:Transcript_42413/g.98233  ORF Transcript_42413/g.98233 Transcript_42413/m.98233 type:complete len:211 (+) Transcript_42413:860-1492(+)